MSRVAAVIPALDEGECIAEVIAGIAPHVDVVIVADNGSSDDTAREAERAGARVVEALPRGYGRACLVGIEAARSENASIVLFLDGDGSDDPSDAPALLAPVRSSRVDISLGVRDPRRIEPGAMTPVQSFGNWLAPRLIRATTGARYHDMPPFKACSMRALDAMHLTDEGHGFTIELLMRAHAEKLTVVEVGVGCRLRRAGTSKVSGTLMGASRAGAKIVTIIGRYAARNYADRARRYLREKKPWARAASRSD